MSGWWAEGGRAIDAPARALLTGEGLKETFALHGPRPAAWRWHLERLERGARAMWLPWPGERRVSAALDAALRSATASGRHGPHRARLLLLAGGPAWPLTEVPEVHIHVELRPLTPAVPGQALRAAIGPQLRDPRHPLAGCKQVAIAADLAALRQAQAAGWDDVLLRDVAGRFSEASTSNLVVGTGDGRVLTPSADCAPVTGTTLAWLRAREGSQWSALRDAEFGPEALRGVRWAVLVDAVRGGRALTDIGAHPLEPPPHVWTGAIAGLLHRAPGQ